MKGKMKSIGAVLGYLALYGIAQIGIWIIVQAVAIGQLVRDMGQEAYLELLSDSELLVETLMESIQGSTAYVLLAINVSVIGLVWLIAKCKKEKLREKIELKKISGSLIGLGILLAVGMYTFDVGLVEVLGKTSVFRNSYIQLENAFKFTDYTPFIVNVLIVGMIAPFAEEVLFRGVVYQALKKHFHIGTVIGVQALLFGLAHINSLQIVYATLMGVLCGYMVYRTKSLWSGVVIHIANNTISCILSALHIGESGMNVPVIILLLLIGMSIVTVGIIKLRKDTTQVDIQGEIQDETQDGIQEEI